MAVSLSQYFSPSKATVRFDSMLPVHLILVGAVTVEGPAVNHDIHHSFVMSADLPLFGDHNDV